MPQYYVPAIRVQAIDNGFLAFHETKSAPGLLHTSYVEVPILEPNIVKGTDTREGCLVVIAKSLLGQFPKAYLKDDQNHSLSCTVHVGTYRAHAKP